MACGIIPRTVSEKRQFWRQVIDGHAGSGLSVPAWCRRRKVSESAFYGWKRKLARKTCEPSGSAPRFAQLVVVDAIAGQMRTVPGNGTLSIDLEDAKVRYPPDSMRPLCEWCSKRYGSRRVHRHHHHHLRGRSWDGWLMLTIFGSLRILVATAPVDFRKSHDGLAAMVRQVLGENPLSGSLFEFADKRADRLKLLYWDGEGLAFCHKNGWKPARSGHHSRPRAKLRGWRSRLWIWP